MSSSNLQTHRDLTDLVDRSLRRNLVVLIGVGVIALFALVVTSILLFEREESTSAWIAHTYGAESRISALSARLEQVETARRGFLIDPDAGFMNVYAASRATIAPMYEDLATFTRDNPRQTRALGEIWLLIAQKFRQCDAMFALAKAGDRAAALHAFRAERAQHMTQRLRLGFADLTREEERLLHQRINRHNSTSLALLASALGLAVLLVGLAAGVWLLLRRYASALARSQAELRQLNAGLETAVEERTVRLTRANEEIQRFAYIVSHDLRSPLVNVMGFTSELETSLASLNDLIIDLDARDPALMSVAARVAVTEDLPEAIGFIRSSTRKMDRLINAILKLSREGRRSLAPEPLAVGALVQGIRDSMRQSIDARGAEIEIEPDLPPLVADRLAVEQVFSNLLENAVKYLRPDTPGRIVVRGAVKGAMRVYEVEDNGRGIAERDRDRVFDLFRRAGVQDQPGEGIGLAHVRALVYRLGGTIDLESEPGRGSLFRMTLPSDFTQELSTE